MSFSQAWESVYAFLEAGGPVLVTLFVVSSLMWTAIFERLAFYVLWQPRQARLARAAWDARSDKASWYARQIRMGLLSRARAQAWRSLPLLKVLVTICPLLGLLGTVTGMLEVFDVMAVDGNSNPRALAAGVSKATISTMAGLVVALSGLPFSTQLQRWAVGCEARLEAALVVPG